MSDETEKKEEPQFKYAKATRLTRWLRKNKKIAQLAAIAALIAANVGLAYKNKELIQKAYSTKQFTNAMKTERLHFADDKEIQKQILRELGGQNIQKTVLMAGDVSEFIANSRIISTIEANANICLIKAENKIYKSLVFLTPQDSNKQFNITGTATIENIVCQSIVVSPKIIFELEITDIFSPELTIEEMIIEDKKVPAQLIHSEQNKIKINPNYLPAHYLDLAELLSKGILTAEDLKDGKIKLEYKAKIDTQKYKRIKKEDVGEIQDLQKHQLYNHMLDTKNNFSINKYPVNNSFVQHVAKILKKDETNPLIIARACYDYTQRALYYNVDSKVPPVPEIMVLGNGKCVDYSNVMTTLLLACGIPAKEPQFLGAVGREGDIKGLHSWVEFMLPMKDGTYKWIMSDPTWGDNKGEEDEYFQCIDDNAETIKHFYTLGIDLFAECTEHAIKQTQHWKIKNKGD